MKTRKTKAAIPEPGLEAIQAATEALDALHQKMTFLQPLAPAERQHIRKVGLQSLRIAEQRLKAAHEHPQAMPAGFDLPQFEQDVAWTERLLACLNASERLRHDLRDTLLVVGGRASRVAAEVYAYIKAGSQATTHLKRAAVELRTRSRSSRSNPEAAPSPATGTAAVVVKAPAPEPANPANPANPEVKAA